MTTRILGACLAWLLAIAPAMAADSPLADAAMARDAAAVRALLAKKADVNAPQGDGSTALHWAVYNGDAELTRLLLAAGADAKAQTRLGGLTPVMMAARAGDAAGAAVAPRRQRRRGHRQRQRHHAADVRRRRRATSTR